jgi:alpha-tubulin suppressor-like RCC1 family protein
MDLENRVSFKLNEYFNEKIKFMYIYELTSVKVVIIIVTKEDKVYEFERNLETLLELDKKNITFIESKIVNELCFKHIIDFKNGWYHVIARTIEGNVYCWGQNVWGVLGNGKIDHNNVNKPELNEYLSDEQVIDVCCGEYHTLVLTNSGEVYAWGDNRSGQIGNGRRVQSIPIKVNGLNGEKVIQISCGYYHSMALTESGRVFSWGNNESGQLGHILDIEIVNKPLILSMSKEIPIKKISCGFAHSLLLACNGDIYGFGNNGCEQQITPKKLIINENEFIDIASHYNNFISIALSGNGIYYIWGNCGKRFSEAEVIEVPKQTEFNSFNEIFNHYIGITYKTIERTIDFNIKIIKNGKYLRECKEIKKLGEGYYGQVFLVKFKDNWGEYTREFAMKKIKFPIDKEEDLVKELENFVSFYKKNTINVLKLYDFWIENEMEEQNVNSITLYIHMELCDTTLKEFIKELKRNRYLFNGKTLTLLGYYIACLIFVEILKGVNYLHTRKPQILHMDLHSGNILLRKGCDNGSSVSQIIVKLADFGLAKICEFAQKSQIITSKKRSNYKSSKVLSDGSYSEKDDIYSLAEIMVELFSIDTKRYLNIN